MPAGIAVDSKGYIYVANAASVNGGKDSITVYSPDSRGDANPAKVIAGPHTKFESLGAIAIDSGGAVYVTNDTNDDQGTAYVQMFAAGSSGDVAPAAVMDAISAHMLMVRGIAFDARDNMYLLGNFFSEESIAFFPRQRAVGMLMPYGAIGFRIVGKKTAISQAVGIAVDTVGDIFVTNSETDSVTVYQSGDDGDVAPSATIETISNTQSPVGLAVDSEGRAYVTSAAYAAERSTISQIVIYPPGCDAAASPIATIGGEGPNDSGLASPMGVAVDGKGDFHVANEYGGYPRNGVASQQGSIATFALDPHGIITTVATISADKDGDRTQLQYPVGAAVNRNQELYVLNSLGSITVYPPGARGNVAPSAAIADDPQHSNTGLDSPAGIALDSGGNIYVTNDGDDSGDGPYSVTIYAARSKGNAKPKATIVGSKTRLDNPHGIAVDQKGKIYVANEGSEHSRIDSVTVYAPGISGNAAPIATISGSHTGLAAPYGIAIGPANLTPEPPPNLAAYDWSAKASPNLASSPPAKDLVVRFIRSIEFSTTGYSDLGGQSTVCSFDFADLRREGNLTLVAAVVGNLGGPCNGLHRAIPRQIYIVDKTDSGFEIYHSYGVLGSLSNPSEGLQDLRHDGHSELIFSLQFATYGSLQSGLGDHCVSVFPLIYKWNGNAYIDVSDDFKEYYRQHLAATEKLIANLPASGPAYNLQDEICLQATAAKMKRFLGGPLDIGLDEAQQLANDGDSEKGRFATYLLGDIGTPQARKDLDTLSNDSDPNVAYMAKLWVNWLSYGSNPWLPLKKLERVR
jgi:NHL repeat